MKILIIHPHGNQNTSKTVKPYIKQIYWILFGQQLLFQKN